MAPAGLANKPANGTKGLLGPDRTERPLEARRAKGDLGSQIIKGNLGAPNAKSSVRAPKG